MKINSCANGLCSLKENNDLDISKYITLVGVIQKADVENENGLIYPKNVLNEAMIAYQKEYIDNGTSVLELDHPEERDLENKAKHVVGILVKYWWEGSYLYGEVRVPINTIHGQIVKGIYDVGGKIGISSRGIGDTEGNTVIELILSAFDLVPQPSVKEAILNLKESIKFNESKNYKNILLHINKILNKYD